MSRLSATSILGILAAMFVLAACQSNGASVAPTAVATPTAAVTEAPGSSDGGLDSFPVPGFAVDPFLAAMLPTQLGGEPVQTIGMSGDDFGGSGLAGSEELQALLGSVGKSPSDVKIAFAATDAITIMAFWVKGVPAASLLPAFVAGIQQSGEMGTVTVKDVTVGGKTVKELDPTEGSASYAYASGEVLFLVGGDGATGDLLKEAFSKLP